MSNDIKKLLRIIEPNLITSDISYEIVKGHSISKHVKFKIIDLLKEKTSFTLIAKLCHVSVTTVIRVLRSIKSYLPNLYQTHLPEVLMVDEFRSHCSSEDTMSFICADGITGRLINILPSRKLTQLTAHFKKYSNPNDVKLLVTDMNAAYFQLTKGVFTSAKIIIDRFHVVKHCNKAFQDFRIKEMKRLKQQNNQIGYLKLKANWHRLTKDRMSINHSEYKTWRSFRAPHYPYQTEAMMIDRLLSYSEPLKKRLWIFTLIFLKIVNVRQS